MAPIHSKMHHKEIHIWDFGIDEQIGWLQSGYSCSFNSR